MEHARNNPALRLADRLAIARRRSFVGRQSELALVREALSGAEPTFAVLHLTGPGGIGKTTLLREYAELAAAAGRLVVLLDGRAVNASPEGVLTALHQALQLDTDQNPIEALAARPSLCLLIDTYEELTPLDAWFRESFLPMLPGSSLIILAGRHPPSEAWRAAPEWHGLIRIVALRNLPPAESHAYLAGRGVPTSHHDEVLAFTHGHPLALALAADLLAGGAGPLRIAESPDLIRPLLDRFIADVPSPLHRAALEVCAHARVTTEPILRAALDHEDVHELFTWLRGLSFIEHGAQGIFPHDLAREAIDADFRWRDPEGYAAMHRRVRAVYLRQLFAAKGAERLQMFFSLTFLHRTSTIMQPYQDYRAFGSFYLEPAQPADYEAILAITRRHEGEEAASTVADWLRAQPAAFVVLRCADGAIDAFGAMLALDDPKPEAYADPVVRAALAYIRQAAPLRAGDRVLINRYFAHRERYQEPTPAFRLFQLNSSIAWLCTPSLAWNIIYYADPEPWRHIMGYIDMHRASAADAELGGRRYAAYAHDWRAVNVAAWFELTGERELQTDFRPERQPPQGNPPLLVLSQPDFEGAVRHALRDYRRPAALQASPLLRSRLVADHPAGATPVALQELIRAAAETLRASPRDEKLYRALHRTYLEPAATQEQAAERLGLPFGTYRTHLGAGVARIVEWLWQREVYGAQ
jgi:hypothetical protein